MVWQERRQKRHSQHQAGAEFQGKTTPIRLIAKPCFHKGERVLVHGTTTKEFAECRGFNSQYASRTRASFITQSGDDTVLTMRASRRECVTRVWSLWRW